MTENKPNMEKAACWYAEHHLPVFPLHSAPGGQCSCGNPECGKNAGKHPRTEHGFKDATTDLAQIEEWWTRWPGANIGLPTGAVSGLLVLDVDPRNGGNESLDRLILEHGRFPDTAEQITGGGGRHFVFRHPNVPVPKELAPGIDLKADGGYIVAAPSIHSSGNAYQWDGMTGPKALLNPADVPLGLLERIAAGRNGASAESRKADGEKWGEGQRNNRLTSIAGTMRRRGLSHGAVEAALLEENRISCCPPLGETEVRGIARSVGAYPPGEKPQPSEQTIGEILEQVGLQQLKKGAPIEEVEQVLRKLAASANGADPLRRVALRSAVMACLENAGVSSPAKLVDAALKESHSADGNGEGRELLFINLEPWPDPVDGDQLLCELAALFERFAVVQKGGTSALSLWVLHTYALAAAYISPILAIVSPEKRCGKTVLLDVLFRLVWRAITVANITAASLFRAVEKWTPTLLVDEADSFMAGNEELRGVINSGHRRDTAKVIRTVGDEHEPRVFSTWGPKAIALIGRLPATLEDRAIVLPMKRKTSGERVERFRPERIAAELEVIRRKAARWAADNRETLRESDPTISEVLNDRAQDNWRPLLAIADAAGGSWPRQARKAAILLSGQDNAGETSAAVQLLGDLRDFFQKSKQDFLSSEDVVEKLLEMEERPWGEWKKGNPITKIQVAAILRKFGVRPRQSWLDGGPSRGYKLADFNDAFSRYLPSESVDSVGTNDDRGLSEVLDSVGNDIHTDPEKRPKGPSIKEPTDSTNSKPLYEANDSLHKEGERSLPPFREGDLPLEEPPEREQFEL